MDMLAGDDEGRNDALALPPAPPLAEADANKENGGEGSEDQHLVNASNMIKEVIKGASAMVVKINPPRAKKPKPAAADGGDYTEHEKCWARGCPECKDVGWMPLQERTRGKVTRG